MKHLQLQSISPLLSIIRYKTRIERDDECVHEHASYNIATRIGRIGVIFYNVGMAPKLIKQFISYLRSMLIPT